VWSLSSSLAIARHQSNPNRAVHEAGEASDGDVGGLLAAAILYS